MTEQIKERPILFSATMVRAILEGRKTVTRREVKKQAALDCLAAGFEPAFLALPGNSDLCPYGRQGDRLWVRETWQDVHPIQVSDGRYSRTGRAGIPGPPGVTYQTIYRADGPYPKVFHTHHHPYRALEPHPDHGFKAPADSGYTGWTPSIHMPRWASRILLEITDVRVERLQDISRADIRAEGLQCPPELESDDVSPNYRDWYPAAWRELWESTGGNWHANPWIWVVEFKQVTP
ncbi:hypothetical protein [Pseudomonas sp. PS01301]|uniref:hypothetical protein n=1 Tax=Pseudomonas sp. PS01301 TaxID=2991437 RepID=UPI00249BB32B|nr:hypothetical protein [Pseudomonas sp. PS01301]